jgi:uncharacterized damage-inducible protein DinB
MQTPNDVIAHSLATSQTMLQRFTADLSPQEYLHRPAEKANCTAWLIGHLALSERRALTMLGAADLPALPGGFDKRFSREAGCPEAAEFGDVTTLMPIFDQHRQRLIDAVRRATPEQLNKPLEKPMPMFKTVGEFVNFMAIHAVMHAGQITIIRRSLGRPPMA